MLRKIARPILKMNFCFFPFLWGMTFGSSLLESFTYEGFLLGTKLFIFLVLISGFLNMFYLEKKRTPKSLFTWYHHFIRLNRLVFPILLVTLLLVLTLEKINYPNYVFKTFHLNPHLFFWPVFLAGLPILIDLFSRKFNLRGKLNYFHLARLIYLLLLLTFVVRNSLVIIRDYYRAERRPEMKSEIDYATEKIDVYDWIEEKFPRVKEVIFWCDRNSQVEDLYVFDPLLTWSSYEGLFRSFMTNCDLHYIVNEETAKEFFEGKKPLKWLASLQECDPEVIFPIKESPDYDVLYLKAVNNYFVCNSEMVLPWLFAFEE